MNYVIIELFLGEIIWERVYVLKVVKKEIVYINMYRGRWIYGNFYGVFFFRVNVKECKIIEIFFLGF